MKPSLATTLTNLPIPVLLSLPILLVTGFYIARYFLDPLFLRDIPGPPLAIITPSWLTYYARRGIRYLAVDKAHKRYGPVIRIAPNHVSINIPSAIPEVYGFKNGLLKSDFYDAFISTDKNIHTGLFNTRSRDDHNRKRKVRPPLNVY